MDAVIFILLIVVAGIAALALSLLRSGYLKLYDDVPYVGFRTVGGDKAAWVSGKMTEMWETDAGRLLKQGTTETHGGPFQVMTRQGPLVILPTSLINQVLMEPRLSFVGSLERMGLKAFPGLGKAHLGIQGKVVFETVLKPLTSASANLAGTLSAEADKSVRALFLIDSDTWQATDFTSKIQILLGRISALLFVGSNLSRSEQWQEVVHTFTAAAVAAETARQRWPVFIRPYVEAFLHETRDLKRLVGKARLLIAEELNNRRRAKPEEKVLTKGQDCLDWFEEIKGYRHFDPFSGQLFLLAAGIHNVSLAMTGLMYDLLLDPKLIEEIRAEAIEVISEGGWTQSSLDQLKLLDSCMRETQRYRMSNPAVLYRRAEESLTLPDGTFVPRGTHTAFPSPRALENSNDTYHGRRFLDMRKTPGQENRNQFSSTGLDYLSMGHGRTACPGRFFASAEIKICFVHLLLKYDWKAVGNVPPALKVVQFMPVSEPIVAFKARVDFQTPLLDL